MELSVNQSINIALAMKQANVQGNFQTAVFKKAVDAFETEAGAVTELLEEAMVDSEAISNVIDILV